MALSLIDKFCRFLETIPNLLLSGAGGLVLALSLVAGAMIERKDLAVAVAIAGTFIGTVLLSFFLPKLILHDENKGGERNAQPY